MVKHDDAVNDPHQHAHDVLDPDNRDAHAAADGAEQVSGALHLGAIKPTQAFVGEQQPRLGGERARELKLLERGGAEPTGLRCGVGRQPDQVERFLRPTLRFRPRNAAGLAVVGGERDVFEQRQLAEWARDLERARDPLVADGVRRQATDFLAFQTDRSRGRA
jgi:hypothetical protein